mmetsp:Transcript_23378/g.74865  ORF Transcript_23378/g.74865 Transcript_23378/m.74865 type:complete len:286 (-) Transcript_23378:382-1239(-)
MPMKPPPAPEQICPQSRVSTSTSRLPSCPSRSEIQTRDLFLLPRSCPATAVRCHCECAASIDTEHSTDRSRTAQHHTSSLRLLLLLLHLCDALFVEADGEVHLEDALHDEELRQPVAEPDCDLVHPVRRDERVLPDCSDGGAGVLLRRGDHEGGSLLGRDLRVWEDHRRRDPERRLALEVDALGLVLAVAGAGQILDVALSGRVAGEQREREASRGRGLVDDGSRPPVDHAGQHQLGHPGGGLDVELEQRLHLGVEKLVEPLRKVVADADVVEKHAHLQAAQRLL